MSSELGSVERLSEPIIEVIEGDNMQLIPAIEQRVQGFNCIILDPPYYDWADRPLPHGDAKDRYSQGAEKPAHNRLAYYTRRLLKRNGIIFLCGTQPQLSDDWQFWKPSFKLVFELIQYKISGTPPINRYQPIRVHENIWCMVLRDTPMKDTRLDIAKMEGVSKGVIVKKQKEDGDPMSIRYGGEWEEWRTGVGYPKSVFTHPQIKSNSKEYYGHPTQKPLALMKQIIKISTDIGDWVLDPYAGSGTTLQACWELGRNCIGIEINPDFIAIIRKRMEVCKAMKKLTHFS